MRDIKIEPIRSVDRAIDILNAFSLGNPSMTIGEIRDIVHLPKATVYRLLYTMERRGMIQYKPDSGLYSLGLKMMEYGGILNASLDVRSVAEEDLVSLQVTTQQTVLMAIRDGETMVYVYKRENPDGLKYSSSIGQRRPLTYGVVGRVLMAYLSTEQQQASFSHLETNVQKSMFRAFIEIRKNRVYAEFGETNIGVTGISSPIFSSDGTCIAAVAVLSPSVLMEGEQLEKTIEMTRKAASVISEKMGFRD